MTCVVAEDRDGTSAGSRPRGHLRQRALDRQTAENAERETDGARRETTAQYVANPHCDGERYIGSLLEPFTGHGLGVAERITHVAGEV